MFTDLSLDDRLLKALDKSGFEKPTPVQAQVIPLALQRRDVMASAETGTGKTAAYMLPALHQLLTNSDSNQYTRMLILVPTRELAKQTRKHFEKLAQFTHLKAGLIIGGDDFKYQKAVSRKNPEVFIATPGRLLEHLSQGNLELSGLEILVLDEADRMLDMGLREDVLQIVEACNPQRQTMILSASLNHEVLADISTRVMNNPQMVSVGGVREPHADIHQQIVLADDLRHKEKLLGRLLDEETFEKALIFTNTRDQADRLVGLVHYFKHKAGVLHGEKNQETRNRVMQAFRGGSINVLIASDLAARGLDIAGIDLVINFDFARKGDEHAHRIGRTGRAGEKGRAISLVTAKEWNLMASVERYLKLNFEHRIVKGLESVFKGPKKVKASGKAVGSKKRKTKKSDVKKEMQTQRKMTDKTAQRKLRKQKHRISAAEKLAEKTGGDGHGPLKRK